MRSLTLIPVLGKHVLQILAQKAMRRLINLERLGDRQLLLPDTASSGIPGESQYER